MKARRAFMLIAVLLTASLLVMLGLGYLSSTLHNYQSANATSSAAQARQLARAGLEDALVKLNKDLDFPPTGNNIQGPVMQEPVAYVYSEDVLDMDGVTLVGSYQVTVDTRYTASAWQWLISPQQLLLVTATGYVGPRSRPTAQATFRIALDMYNPDTVRAGPDTLGLVQDPSPSNNTQYFKVRRFEDMGGL